jgi:hypothetical protein
VVAVSFTVRSFASTEDDLARILARAARNGTKALQNRISVLDVVRPVACHHRNLPAHLAWLMAGQHER